MSRIAQVKRVARGSSDLVGVSTGEPSVPSIKTNTKPGNRRRREVKTGEAPRRGPNPLG